MSQPLVFFQCRIHSWYFSTVKDAEGLADGATFQAIYAPGAGNLKQWLRVRFRVGRYFNRALKRIERVYFEEYSEKFDELPLLDGETLVETFGIEAAIQIK